MWFVCVPGGCSGGAAQLSQPQLDQPVLVSESPKGHEAFVARTRRDEGPPRGPGRGVESVAGRDGMKVRHGRGGDQDADQEARGTGTVSPELASIVDRHARTDGQRGRLLKCPAGCSDSPWIVSLFVAVSFSLALVSCLSVLLILLCE